MKMFDIDSEEMSSGSVINDILKLYNGKVLLSVA